MDRDYRKYIPNVPSPLRTVSNIPRAPNPEFCAIVVTSLDPSIALKDLYDRFAKCGLIVGFVPALDTSFPIHGAIWVEYASDSDAAQAISELNGTCRWGLMCGDIMIEYDQDGAKFAEAATAYARETRSVGKSITRGSSRRRRQPKGPSDTHHIQASFGAAASSPIPLKSRPTTASPLSLGANSTSNNHHSSSSSTTMLPTKRKAEGLDVDSTPIQKKLRRVKSDGLSSSDVAYATRLTDSELARMDASSSSSTPKNTQPHLTKSTGGVAKSVSSPQPAMQNPSSSTSTVPSVRADGIYKVPIRNDRTNVPSSNSTPSQATTSTRTGKEKASVTRNGAGSSASKNAGLPTKGARSASS